MKRKGPILLLYMDDGPDHRVMLLSACFSEVGFGNADSCSYSSWIVSCLYSINLAIQNVAISRDPSEMDKKLHTMAEIRNLASTAPLLKSTWRNSLKRDGNGGSGVSI